MTAHLSLRALEGLPLVQEGDDLYDIILGALEREAISPLDGDVFVLAQKIVSKAEGRAVSLNRVQVSDRAVKLAAEVGKDPRLVELILSESLAIIRRKPGVLIVEHRLGLVMANAGIDRSNVAPEEDIVLLLPLDPDGSAARLREQLQAHFGVQLAVVIADSVGRAWRLGTVGIALGSAGLPALQDLRGRRDLFNRALGISEHGVSDAVAAAAELLMGEANEATPVVLISGLPSYSEESSAKALQRPEDEDLFR